MEIKKFGFYFLFLIITLLAIKFYTLVYFFFPSVAAACVFAYIFNPLYLFFFKKIKRRSISALIVIGIIFFLILVPVTLIIVAGQQQMEFLFSGDTIGKATNIVNSIETFIRTHLNIDIADRIVTLFMEEVLPRIFSSFQAALTYIGPKLIISVTRFILTTFITIFIMYYLLIHSGRVVKVFRDYFPISLKNSEILLKEMGHQTKALIYGQLLISIIQGSLGAVGFFIFGIGGALFWGVIMVIMSFLPLVGATVIWLPAVIVLLAKGEFLNAGGLFLWGALVVGTIDNLIRPKLTETIGKIHPVTVLLGVLIGIGEWGFIGIVIGPLMISVLLVLIKMFREEYLVE